MLAYKQVWTLCQHNCLDRVNTKSDFHGSFQMQNHYELDALLIVRRDKKA